MRKKRWILPVLSVSLLLLAALIFLFWYRWPVHFLQLSEEISSIEVFDGNTGNSFTISEPTQIADITENIQSISFRRSGLSLHYSGFRFRMSFLDSKGNEQAQFVLNSESTICQDPFFFKALDGKLCIDLLEKLENQLS